MFFTFQLTFVQTTRSVLFIPIASLLRLDTADIQFWLLFITHSTSSTSTGMGGHAFDKTSLDGTALSVPRIKHGLYCRLMEQYTKVLQHFFTNVLVPREVPNKADYGDIDFLVEGSIGEWSPQAIGQALGAEYYVSHGNTHSFAVPYTSDNQSFVQIDVEICPGNDTADAFELLPWTCFMKSDGDLLQIIGITHRSLGLICNDKGLHVSLEEIASHDKKKSMLFLTRDPREAITFFGLNLHKYLKGFQDEDDILHWVVSGRFFNRTLFDARVEKANDRQRQAKRPMYARFIERFMPAYPDNGTTPVWTRQSVLEEALKYFEKKYEYQTMIAQHQLLEKDKALWKRIKESLPLEGNKDLGLTLKGLKKWVDFVNGQPCIAVFPVIEYPPVWARAVKDEDKLLHWVSEHWEQVRDLEKRRSVSYTL